MNKDDWIVAHWMGRNVIQARGSADCIGRTGKVDQTFFDQNGALHCHIVKESAHGMSSEWWCPAALLERKDVDQVTETETIFFNVINPDNVEEETRIYIYINPEDKRFAINNIPIDAQQLAELGMLLFAIAHQHDKPDTDSCIELLDGFTVPAPKKALLDIVEYISIVE